MRIDKFLKVSRIIKRRTVAATVCDAGKVLINDKVAKSSTNVKIGDIVCVTFGAKVFKFKVMNLNEAVKAQDAQTLYEIIE